MALLRHLRSLRQEFASQPAVGNAVIAIAVVAMSVVGVGVVTADQWVNSKRAASIVSADAGLVRSSEVLSVSGRMIPTQDEWIEQVKTKDFWNKISRQSGNSYSRQRAQEPPNRVGAPMPGLVNVAVGKWSGDAVTQRRSVVNDDEGDEDGAGGRKGGGGSDSTYRTVCVRLCDGFYTPLSFSTTRDKFERDAERCEASCGGQARMFFYKSSGSQVEDMEDLDGKSYKKLPTAFAFRTTYNAQCTCRPQPWSQEAKDRHKLYALQEAGSKGDKAAKQKADDIVARQKKAEADAAAEKTAAEKAAKKSKAAEKDNKKPSKGKSADLAPVGAELVKAGMTLPLTRSTTRPMSRVAGPDARSEAPALTKVTVIKTAPARLSPFEPLPASRTRTAEANGVSVAR